MAKQLIDVAAESGADAVKFQTYTGKDLYSSKTPRFEYLDDERSPQELLDAIALPREWQPELAEHAQGRGIAFFSSPFDRDAVDSLVEAGVTGAEDRVVRAGRPATDHVRRANRAPGHPLDRAWRPTVRSRTRSGRSPGAGNDQVALLRCASVYPAEPEIMNLRAMGTMRDAFGVPVGLSDHTRGIAVAAAAAALGAELVEKHFTLSRELEGPDHPFALEPDELKAMVAGIREAEAALGSGRLEGPSEAESGEMYQLARRSVIAATDIPAGTVITEEMLDREAARATASNRRTPDPRRPNGEGRHRVRRRHHLGDGLKPGRSTLDGLVGALLVDEGSLAGALLDRQHLANEERVVSDDVLRVDAAIEPAHRAFEQRIAGRRASEPKPVSTRERPHALPREVFSQIGPVAREQVDREPRRARERLVQRALVPDGNPDQRRIERQRDQRADSNPEVFPAVRHRDDRDPARVVAHDGAELGRAIPEPGRISRGGC